MRANVGCGEFPLRGWVNIDADPRMPAEVHATVPPLPFEDRSLVEIYAGHFLEHLSREEAGAFLVECFRCLVPGGRLGIVVPDTREIMARYLADDVDSRVEYPMGIFHTMNDLDAISALFLYSTVQGSPHRWSYDAATLRRALEGAGFRILGPIDRWRDPRIPVGAWYQMGLDAVKPGGA